MYVGRKRGRSEVVRNQLRAEIAENYPDNPGIQSADASSEVPDGSVQESADGNDGGLLSALDKMFTLHVKAAVLYKSFTLDYNRQSDEYTWINICNARPDSMDIFDLLWGDGKSMEDMNNGMQKMLDNTVITCTVQYTDQTSQSVNIKVNTKIMSCAEAGEESKYEDEKSVYITFELQE